MKRFTPNKDFTACEPADSGFSGKAVCEEQCIDSYNDCVAGIDAICPDCGNYCERECDPTNLLGSGYCESICTQRPDIPDCMSRCRKQVLQNQGSCVSACENECNADCHGYLQSRCMSQACTLPICQQECRRGQGEYYLAPSLLQSLLNKPSYYCKMGRNVNNNCLGFNRTSNTWFYQK